MTAIVLAGLTIAAGVSLFGLMKLSA